VMRITPSVRKSESGASAARGFHSFLFLCLLKSERTKTLVCYKARTF